MLDKSKVRKIKFISTFLCLVVIGILGYFFIQSFKNYVQIEEKHENELRKRVHLENEIDEIKVSIEKFKKDQAEFETLLFSERDVPSFIDGISSFAKEANVNIVDMKTQKFAKIEIPEEMLNKKVITTNTKRKRDQETRKIQDRKKEAEQMLTLAAMPIKIKLDGEFESIAQFLMALESYKQFVTINDVEITSNKKYPILACDFTLRIYSLKTLEELQ